MPDPKQPSDSSSLPLQGPHWKHSDLEPANMLPLRLVLQPSGSSLESFIQTASNRSSSSNTGKSMQMRAFVALN